jgi:hypothetical protein
MAGVNGGAFAQNRCAKAGLNVLNLWVKMDLQAVVTRRFPLMHPVEFIPA